MPLPSASTSPDIPLILRLVYESAKIVNGAGDIVKKVVNSGKLGIIDKGGNDPQTIADRVAQQYIVMKLLKKFPNVSIIGEEPEDSIFVEGDDLLFEDLIANACINDDLIKEFKKILKQNVPDELLTIQEEDVVIWVDPLDGTQEFTEGSLESVTVLVGIAAHGVPVGGIIHQPFAKAEKYPLGRTLWGIPQVGTNFKLKCPPKGQRIITTTTRKSNNVGDSSLEAFKPDRILRVGGTGHKATFLFDGKAHAYVSPRTKGKKWDTCAPEAILRALGGTMTNMRGKPYSYDKEAEFGNDQGILATVPGEDHSWYVNATAARELSSEQEKNNN